MYITKSPNHMKIQKIQFLFFFYHYKETITSQQSLHFSRFLLHNRKKVAEGRLFKNILFVT